jgi:hypothetical protein
LLFSKPRFPQSIPSQDGVPLSFPLCLSFL